MSPLTRYVLLQIPGELAVGLALWWAVSFGWLRPGVAVLLFALWVVKDALLYPFSRLALSRPPPTGGQALVGRRGVLVRATAPRGQLRLGGELWTARAPRGERIEAGTEVRVVAAEGLVLLVEPVERR